MLLGDIIDCFQIQSVSKSYTCVTRMYGLITCAVKYACNSFQQFEDVPGLSSALQLRKR